MKTRQLPPRPHLDQYRKQAKDLLQQLQARDPDALQEARQHHPRLAGADDTTLAGHQFTLADAQLIISRAHGFSSWPPFQRAVADARRRQTPRAVKTVWPDLHAAIWSGRVTALRKLLEEGADISQLTDHHQATHATVLHSAAFSGRNSREILDLLFHHGAGRLLEVECAPGEEGRFSGHTPLQVAAKRGHSDIARDLISRGARHDVFSAAALGDLDCLRNLTPSNPDRSVSLRDHYAASPLHWAAEAGQFAAARFLLDHGADLNARNDFAETPLLLASLQSADKPSSRLLTRELLDHGAKMDIFTAAALGDRTSLEQLLNANPSAATSTNDFASTPLHWAARNGHLAAAELLLTHGAKINAADRFGCTPLWHAAYPGRHLAMVRLLCERGADVTLRNVWGRDLDDYDCGECGPELRRFKAGG